MKRKGAENAKEPASSLSPDQIEVLLRADLKNLARKVSAGRSLTKGERSLLKSQLVKGATPDDAAFASNQVELAKALGVDRKTIQRHRRIPGNPGVRPDGRYDIDAWREQVGGKAGGDSEDMSQTQLKARQVLLQNERLEVQIGILRRDYVLVTDVEKWAMSMAANAKRVLYNVPDIAPQVVGLTVPDAEQRLREVVDEALTLLSVKPWEE